MTLSEMLYQAPAVTFNAPETNTADSMAWEEARIHLWLRTETPKYRPPGLQQGPLRAPTYAAPEVYNFSRTINMFDNTSNHIYST